MSHNFKEQALVINELTRRVAELEQRIAPKESSGREHAGEEERSHSIFNSVPMSIWEEDLSQLKQAIDNLKDQGVGDFRKFLEEHPDFVSQAIHLIRVTDVNEATLKLYRAESKEELLGSPDRARVPESMEAFKEELIAIAEEQKFFETEAVSMAMDGQLINVHVCISIPVEPSQFKRMFLVITDLSARKQAEEALRVSEGLFKAVFQSANDCIYIKDTQLRFTHVNPALARLVGRPAADLVGLTSQDLYGLQAGNHIAEVDRRVLEGESIEEEHTRPISGTLRTFHDIRVPLRDAAGGIVGICGISRDITERKWISPVMYVAERPYPSASMTAVLEKARLVASTESSVLLLGESGSGKDFVARYIHAHSRRSHGAFYQINCAALSHELAESELFGHEAGAFTGARGRKKGLLELAEGGTLLLNEIGELSQALQAKLLVFLETKSFTRLGGERTIHVDARLMAATHRDLRAEVAQGRFLLPLYYRLDVFTLWIPPLRDRFEDIPMLVEELLAKVARNLRLSDVPALDAHQMAALCRHSWPGNVRELRNMLERALILWTGGPLEVPLMMEEPPLSAVSEGVHFPDKLDLRRDREDFTLALCKEALRRAKGNRNDAAHLLGVSRFTFYRYLKKLQLDDCHVTENS